MYDEHESGSRPADSSRSFFRQMSRGHRSSTLNHKHRSSGDDPSINRFYTRREKRPGLSIYVKLIRRRFVRARSVINLAGLDTSLNSQKFRSSPTMETAAPDTSRLASCPEVNSTRKTHSYPLFLCAICANAAAARPRRRRRPLPPPPLPPSKFGNA